MTMVCSCGKGDDAPAIVHAEDCLCIDWIYGPLEGGFMSDKEKDPTEVAVEEADERDPNNLATPTEKKDGAGGDSPGLHDGGSVNP